MSGSAATKLIDVSVMAKPEVVGASLTADTVTVVVATLLAWLAAVPSSTLQLMVGAVVEGLSLLLE
ncbi:hypothetical protein D3C80_2189960 [compost metagenome]